MNKPAPKEPSMDEILSSIRQIIADDDAGLAPRKPAVATPAVRMPPRAPEPEPLALSAEQILRDAAEDDSAGPGLSFDEILGQGGMGSVSGGPSLVDPEDIAFEMEEEPVARQAPAFHIPERSAPKPAPVAQAAPMPDLSLSDDMAEQLLEPTTEAAVRSTLGRITNVTTVASGVTIEQLMRDMLRPMLKEWLDENLPAMVERIVEQEIARASRGGR